MSEIVVSVGSRVRALTIAVLLAVAASLLVTIVSERAADVQAVSPITQRYNALGGPASFLGAPVGPEENADFGGRYRQYERGFIFWGPASGTYEVHGAIYWKWAALGWEFGLLGFPVSDEIVAPDGVGRFSRFERGSIYWSPATGAHEVHGAIYWEWAEHGYELPSGLLGYPTTDELVAPDGIGRYANFQRGSIYWSPATGAHEVRGAIYGKWAEHGYELSFGLLGYPTTDELVAPDGVGRYTHFQRGSIYWTPTTGAHEVHGPIRDRWASLGWERSYLGYPVSDEHSAPLGRQSDFQNGFIHSTASSSAILAGRAPKSPTVAGGASADSPDPAILRSGNTWYAFTTETARISVPMWTSGDAVSWRSGPAAMPAIASWAQPAFHWSPSVVAAEGKYVMWYTARDAASGRQCVGRAVASAPSGPYVDSSSAPVVCQAALGGSIDPHVFTDTNGSRWLYWKSDENNPFLSNPRPSRLWVQPLSADATTLVGTASVVLEATDAWGTSIVEQPAVVRQDGLYYLFYSGGWYNTNRYATGYAVATSPTGPFIKQTVGAPWLAGPNGPGGLDVFDGPDGTKWAVYHVWVGGIGYPTGHREMRIAPLRF